MSDIFDLLSVPKHDDIIIRRSILETTCSCPFQAMQIRDGKVDGGGYLAEVGNEGHRVMAEAVAWGKGDKREVIEYLEEELPKTRPDLQPDVLRSTRGVAKTLRKIPVEKIVSVEKQYSYELMPATESRGAVIITCCMDIVLLATVETELHVHDWKTGYKKRSNSGVLDEFQTQFYCTVLFKVFPELQKIHFWYEQTRFGDRVYGCAERETHLDNFEMRVRMAIQDYLSKTDEARPDVDKCSWCNCTAICPYITGEAKTLTDNPSEYFAQYIARLAHTKKMKQAMDAYCFTNNEIVHGDNVYGWVPPKRTITYKPYKKKKVTDEHTSD